MTTRKLKYYTTPNYTQPLDCCCEWCWVLLLHPETGRQGSGLSVTDYLYAVTKDGSGRRLLKAFSCTHHRLPRVTIHGFLVRHPWYRGIRRPFEYPAEYVDTYREQCFFPMHALECGCLYAIIQPCDWCAVHSSFDSSSHNPSHHRHQPWSPPRASEFGIRRIMAMYHVQTATRQ